MGHGKRGEEALARWAIRARAAKKNQQGEIEPARAWVRDVRPAWLAFALLERARVDSLPAWFVAWAEQTGGATVEDGRLVCTLSAFQRFIALSDVERGILYCQGWTVQAAVNAHDIEVDQVGRVIMLRSAWLEGPTQAGRVMSQIRRLATKRWAARWSDMMTAGGTHDGA